MQYLITKLDTDSFAIYKKKNNVRIEAGHLTVQFK